MRLPAIGRASNGTYTVTRQAPATTDGNGRMVAGATSTFTVTGSLQPMSGRELRTLPEARQADEMRVLYTTTELRTGAAPDLVAAEGSTWEVYRVARWDAFGSVHYVVQLARKELS